MNFQKAGLVLEGGGLRGIYTSGVLRLFVDRGLYFPYVIGVSMGACNAANFVSEQPERNRIVNTRFVKETRYLSYLRFLAGGDLFGMDFIFDTIPNRLVPFDYERLFSSPVRLVTTVTDCRTGEALYFEKSELGADFLTVLRASSSLPFISKIVEFRGRSLLDGGLSDSVPIRRCLAEGNRKAVLVLTREKGYRKKPSRPSWFARLRYSRYPGLLRSLETRWAVYNETMDYIDDLEAKEEIFVLRPERPLEAGRVERNKDKLYLVYDSGYAEAESRYADLAAYLAK